MTRTVKILNDIDAVSTEGSQIQVLLRVLSAFEEMETGDTTDSIIARVNIDVDTRADDGPILISSFSMFYYSDDEDDDERDEIPMCLGSIKGTVQIITSTFLKT